MAAIQDANSGATTKVDSVSSAMRSVLYNSGLDKPLAKKPYENVSSSCGHIVLGGIDNEGASPVKASRCGWQNGNTLLWQELFEGATVNAQRLVTNTVSNTIAQSVAGGLRLNNGAITTLNAASLVASTFRVPLDGKGSTSGRVRALLKAEPGMVAEIGFTDTTTGQATGANSASFRYDDGSLNAVLYYNTSVTAASSSLALPIPASVWHNKVREYEVIVESEFVDFIIHDIETGEKYVRRIDLDTAQGRTFTAPRLPLACRIFNQLAPVVPGDLQVFRMEIWKGGILNSVDFDDYLSLSHLAGSAHPLTGAQTTNAANNTAPGLVSLSNTVASYITPDGNFLFSSIAGAETDYCLFGFQVPAGCSFRADSVVIETRNRGAIAATAPNELDWYLSHNQAAVSLASGSLKKFLGSQTIPVGAAIGFKAERIEIGLRGLVTGPNRFQVVVLRMIGGAATASQVIRGSVNVMGKYI